ncbi:Hsp33 family molecular chaperone HslO [Vibrio gazogenes]|uniref:33 kDa chaperonin n=1 Tax=Vibrio gazogenes DSM 21264 = NBRC 103151 TaxID=1123492 RepID=A0A1M5FRJ2_VIBGA|nr:Hsp33 family molecular chaperone HslO [Vibrio gazogenes]USP13574.1 Hsp33 family molecular chaperone HslO [Vibrio gazogenes]SHF93771.1 molecular chaperone Hsp33 [Vibrio gazogenes DSM 21264] [Vibrio gazogenes DSM 21264 = NBRC 103151]
MASNMLNRYLFDELSVRGELVQLDDVYQQVVSSQEYPAPIQSLLGELLVATSLLTATLKFEGSITLQIQGNGPVSLAVLNGDHEQNVRGVARWKGDIPEDATLHQLMGDGHLVITIDPDKGERYQGIVALDGDCLANVLETYFAQSEQLKTRLWIKTGRLEEKLCAAGMLLQIMPDGTGSPDDFEHLEQLTNTVTDEELFSLEANELLYRLYNQETVRLFEPQPITFHCGCSRQRCGAAIITLPENEVQEMLAENPTISLHCEYCGTDYQFDENDIKELRYSSLVQNKTIH